MATRTVTFRHDEIRTNPNGYAEVEITSDLIHKLYRSMIHAEHVETRDGVGEHLPRRVDVEGQLPAAAAELLVVTPRNTKDWLPGSSRLALLPNQPIPAR